MDKADKRQTTFRQECSIAVKIRATPSRIWGLLTNTKEMPSWNSTLTRIEGDVKVDSRLAIEVPASKGRVFRPTVTELTPEKSMVWSDGTAPFFKGVRSYTLSPNDDGTTTFTMSEVFSGMMLPMIRGSLPDFGPIFETYAADLKRAAEE
jgi:hypothetical protein